MAVLQELEFHFNKWWNNNHSLNHLHRAARELPDQLKYLSQWQHTAVEVQRSEALIAPGYLSRNVSLTPLVGLD